MKKVVLIVLAVLLAAGSFRAHAQDSGTTVIRVTVVAEKETVRVGPYARFAQKYLGVMAPLSDKNNCRILSASLDYSGNGMPVDPYVEWPGNKVVSHTKSDSSFVKVQVDKMSVSDGSAESMASNVANTIFTLRKKRMELITGDAGENVFGGGLAAALNEIDRLENEYLALFLGKQYIKQEIKTFEVTPEPDSKNAVAFRFNESTGIVPVADLSGRPVTLEFSYDGGSTAVPDAGKKGNYVLQRVPVVASCRLMDGKTELAQAAVPVAQFGKYIQVPVSK